MNSFYQDDSAVSMLTDQLTSDGVRLLSFFRMDENDTEHVRQQLLQMNLVHGARILDAGCGVGEFARLASAIRPDLRFTLLNISKSQLELCPDGHTKINSDFHSIPVEDGEFDAVLLDYAIGHGEIVRLLVELSRVLKHGGMLFIHDLFRGDDTEQADAFSASLGYSSYTVSDTVLAADLAGLVLNQAWEDRCSASLPEYVVGPVRTMLGGMDPASLRFLKSGRSVADAMNAHDAIAMQYSGGKDSTAVLYLLRPWWDKMTVYWTNTGDPVPETVEVINQVRAQVSHFVEIKANVKAWRELNGIPSDIVSFGHHPIGNMLGFGDIRLSNRFDCCWNNLMLPMHQRMREDKVTLIVRGTKDSDMPTQPLESGSVHDGIEILYPIQDWTDSDVFGFLEQEGAPVAEYYAFGAPTAPECLGCTAWWDDKKAAFMAARHPEQYAIYRNTLERIRESTLNSLACLDSEIKGE